jgi:hypothetical protein
VNKSVFGNNSVNKIDLEELDEDEIDSDVLHLKSNIFLGV